MRITDKRIKVIISLASIYLLWSTTYIAIKYAITGVPPLLMCGIRFLIAGVITYLYLIFRGEKHPPLKEWGACAVSGFLMFAMGTGFVALAMKSVGSGLCAVAIAAVTIWACILGPYFGRKASKVEWTGVAIGMAGIVLLNFENDFKGNFIGALFLLIAAPAWALGSFAGKKLDAPKGLMGNALAMTAGGALTLLLGFISGERLTAVPSVVSVTAIFYLIIFGSLVGFTAYMYLFEHTSPALATSYSFVNPVGAVIIGVIFGKEIINAHGFAAMALITLGVIFITLWHRDREKVKI
jgi:drug/metabolite transporter (DMT)-like permease